MIKFVRTWSVLGILFLLCGCSNSWFSNSEEVQEPEEYSSPFYFSEFPDVPIDNKMGEKKTDTFITFTGSGSKVGVQVFTGHINQVDLMNETRKNMSAQGWSLRSLLRGKKSLLVFEKPDRFCSVILTEGMLYTTMTVFVSSRLSGDTGNMGYDPSMSGGYPTNTQGLTQ